MEPITRLATSTKFRRCGLPAAIALTVLAPIPVLVQSAPVAGMPSAVLSDDLHSPNRPGAVPGTLIWEDRVDDSDFEQAFSVAALGGRVFVSGFVTGGNGLRDFVVRAYNNRNGSLDWQDRLDLGSDEFASGVAADSDRVFVSGVARIAGRGNDWVLRAYDADTGVLLWQDVFDWQQRSDLSRGTALAAAEGMVFLGGNAGDATGDADWHIRAYNARTGALVWQDHFESGPDVDIADTLVVGAGRVVVGGTTSGQDASLVRAYNARTGELLWRQEIPGFSARGKVVFSDRVVYAYSTLVAPGPAFALVTIVEAYDAGTGTLLWHDEIRSGGDVDLIEDIAAHRGTLHAVGLGGPRCLADVSPPSNCDVLLRTYDGPSGSLLWERLLDLSGVDDDAKVVAADNRTLFVGSLKGPLDVIGQTSMGAWLVQAFDSKTGELRWETAGGELETPLYNMTIHKGRLFIPGRSVDPSTGAWDFIVRAYDARSHAGEKEDAWENEGMSR